MSANYVLKLESPHIKGEGKTPGHNGDIDVLSWSHSFNQPTSASRSSAGGGTVEQANHADFSFTKYIDTATDDLLKMCWSGKQIGKGTFTAYRSDGDKAVKYLTIEFKNIIVSNYSVGGGKGDLPVETVTLSYAWVSYTYHPIRAADGSGGRDEPVTHDLVRQMVS